MFLIFLFSQRVCVVGAYSLEIKANCSVLSFCPSPFLLSFSSFLFLSAFLSSFCLSFFPSTFMSLCWFVHMNIMYLIIMGLLSLFSLYYYSKLCVLDIFTSYLNFQKNWYPGFKNCFLLHLQKCLLN